MQIVIERQIPSQNEFQYSGWRKYRRERNMWYTLLRSKLIPRQPVDRKMAAIIVSYRPRLLDMGNLVGGAKPIPDGLKRLGYIRDDSPEWFTAEYRQIKVPGKQARTEITLHPVGLPNENPHD